VPHETGLG